MTPTRIVIGIGNPLRGDDGIGPALVADLAADPPSEVELRVSGGDPFDLITAWTGAGHAVVVDAAQTGQAPPGTIHRWDPRLTPPVAQVGSHGLGLAEAIAISDVLGRTPRELVVLAVEVGNVSFGATLSAEVAQALPELRRAAELALHA